ncbi:pitrilysin family protein [Mucilaginibacter sp. PAMB04274]|uniref:M16 family metallopeptidase n=1 Tax=Mucilaginibacter sp. PAMB04274 TaxID=3138568 RepID=UPI0031F68508
MVTIKKTMLACALSAMCTMPVMAQKATAKKAAAKALPAPVKVTAVEGITEYKLANGMRVLLFPDQTKQTTTVNITYLVGSKFENYGETGMAHLLEHMVFKGTPKHRNIPQELNAHGADFNGTTWLDRTNYYETVPSTDENLNWALDLEADRMINSYIAKTELDKEFSVVRNEMESGENSPQRILSERVLSTMFLWHNYGKSTIGNRADVEKVPIDRLQAFYRKYYQPDNAILTVAGKFDPTKTLAAINQKFGSIAKPARILPANYTVEPVQDGERTVTLRRVGDIQAITTGYHVPSGPHPDTQPLNVLIGLLTDQPSGRLYKKLVEPKKATRISGYDYETADPGVALFNVEVPKDKNIDEAKDILLSTVETFSAEKPTAPEVERIVNKQLKDIELALNSSENVGLNLSEYIAQGDWRLLFYQRDQLKKVTPGDVVRVADKYFKPSNRTLGVFVPTEKPERAEVPATPDLAAMLKGYTGSQTIAQGEAFDASPANIQKRVTVSKIGGITLNALTKQTRGEVVVANMNFYFGNEAALQGKGTAASFTASMLNKGTKNKTRQQIQDELDKLKARVGFSGGANNLQVSIETNKANFPAVLKLVAEIMKEASFPGDELDKLKQQRIAATEQQRSEPTNIAVIELQRYTNPYEKTDPRYVSTIDESIAMYKAVSEADVKNFYKDFYGASNAYISIIGDFDAAQAKSIITQEFSNWKSPQTFARLIPKRKDFATLNKSIETPDKANAFFIGLQPLKLSMKDADYPALIMADYMIGGGALSSRLANRIRQKEGISYGVGSGLSAGYFDQNTGVTQFYAIYAPENAARLDAAFKEEIEKVIKDGFTDQEVAEAKKGYLQSRGVSLAQDNVLAGTLNTYSYYGENIAFWQKTDDAVSKLTTAQINAAAKRYYDPTKISIVKAGDFAKKKPTETK